MEQNFLQFVPIHIYAGVKEVYVFCCSHSKQVIAYLENSEWSYIPKFTVKTIVSRVCKSVGDALHVGQIAVEEMMSCSWLLIWPDTKSEDEELEKTYCFTALDIPNGVGSEDGVLGVGSSWLYCEEECRNLVAPFPADEKVITNLRADSVIANIKDMDNEDFNNDLQFKKKVEETLLRAVHEGVGLNPVILEVDIYKLLNIKEPSDCAEELFYQVMK
ncbi:hypothetical protein IFM89_000208 [Coptis chinensis]|uniref:Uncharacterized protein n=1 Tax=Coptis chinensis TaxID=261450 RepID=A0A835LYQ7_9MAGN|nr:hypothetical protein IFM89_000208 [Coptis chinensis]